MALVSIIVPVFNVENFLRRCVDSILKQTFTDFELILVDDGSQDHCGIICDEYARLDSRVVVIHRDNGGLASARNAGLDIASGEYILFCDSDDYVLPYWCEHLLKSAQDHHEQYVFGNMLVEYHTKEQTFREKKKLYSGEYSFSDFFIDDLPGYACNAVFRLDICNSAGIRFPEDVIVEDLPFVLAYFSHCEGIYACSYAEYIYYHDERETLSNKYRIDGYTRWQEKYQRTKKGIELLIPSNMIAEAHRSIANRYLHRFLNALNNTFDSRNKDNLIQKLRFNQKVVNTDEFQECLHLADGSQEDRRYLLFLKMRNYYFAYFLVKASGIKRKLRGTL